MVKLILAYVITLQGVTLLSTAFVCVVYVVLKYIFHMTSDKVIKFLSTHSMLKISCFMSLAEILSMLLVLPILATYYNALEVTYVEVLIFSMVLLLTLPLFFKIRAVHKMLYGVEKNDVPPSHIYK